MPEVPRTLVGRKREAGGTAEVTTDRQHQWALDFGLERKINIMKKREVNQLANNGTSQLN